MNLNEAAMLLKMTREEVRTVIEQGVELPKSRKNKKLKAHLLNEKYDIEDTDLGTRIK